MELLHGKELRFNGRVVRLGYIDGEGYQFLDDPEAAVESLRKSRARVDIFTFIQRLSETEPKYKFPMELDNFAALPIITYDQWLTKQIDFKVRNKVRKAGKNGVVVKEVPFDDALIHGISGIYNEAPIRQGRRFWHYKKDFESLRQMKATFLERAIFIGAYLEEQLIGIIKLVTDENRGQAGLMHIVSMIKHRDKAPTNALLAQAVKSCADRNIRYLWYANFSYRQKKGEDSLAEFKRHNGFLKIDVPRYYVPLTAAGRMALRMGLHHNMLDRIPEPVAAALRKIRSRWYAIRFPSLQNG